VVLAIVLFTRRKFAWAVALASLASMQNQPILVFSTLLAVASACTPVRQSVARKATGVALAWGLGFVPTVFYFMLFGTPNLIAANGEAGVHFITLRKIIGTYFDLNQGMIIYLPGLVLLWMGTLVLAIRRKSFSILLAVTAVGMAVLSATTANWNSGAVGLMRYAVWQMPVLAWGAIAVLSSGKRWERRALYSLAASQLVVALVVLAWPAYAPDYLHHGPVATYVLNHRPALYSPDVDIFWDRTTHFEVADSVKNQSGTITESIGFSGPDGLFRKLLTLDSEVPYAAGKLGISEEQFRRDSYSAGRPGLWYTDLYPPR
jgi:hypothetical protein